MLLLSTFAVYPQDNNRLPCRRSAQHGVIPDKSTFLTSEEDAALVNYLVHIAQCGIPLMRNMVKSSVAKRSGIDRRFHPDLGPGYQCCSLFKKRHPELLLRKVDSLRAEASMKT